MIWCVGVFVLFELLYFRLLARCLLICYGIGRLMVVLCLLLWIVVFWVVCRFRGCLAWLADCLCFGFACGF